ncbi:hypothetical protein HNR44_003495 [Geomicrobium halophilum]|uniref:Uncharacterized protein n=1 Tax=Geomicrobium halophilum TaxID=549000 RepID=A0A841PUS4_9BACL|nr:hypothetical protein [Geomicrobium halophilum]MBB6451484.1 hypothetical protein [Geomicrobium halophilum]
MKRAPELGEIVQAWWPGLFIVIRLIDARFVLLADGDDERSAAQRRKTSTMYGL